MSTVWRGPVLALLVALALAGCSGKSGDKAAGPPDMASDTGMNASTPTNTPADEAGGRRLAAVLRHSFSPFRLSLPT